MKIMSLDLSLNHTGWADFTGDEFIRSGLIEPNLGKRKEILQGAPRLSVIMGHIELLTEEKVKPDIVVIEDVSFGSRGKSIIDIGELHGIVKLYFYRKGIPIVLVAPPTLKLFISGKGNAQKNLNMLKIYKDYNIEFKNDNEADAWSLGMLYICYLKYKEGKNGFKDYQIRAIKSIEKKLVK